MSHLDVFFILGGNKCSECVCVCQVRPPLEEQLPKKEVLELAERVHFDSLWTVLGPARADRTRKEMLCILRFGSFLDSGQEFAFSNCLGKPPRSFGFEI